jgi:hypothetical protein
MPDKTVSWQVIAFVADSSERLRSKIRGAWASAGPWCLLPRSFAHPILSLGKCQNCGPFRPASVFLGPLGDASMRILMCHRTRSLAPATSTASFPGAYAAGSTAYFEENCSSSRSTERRGVSVPYNPGANHLSAAAIILNISTHPRRPTTRFISISGSLIKETPAGGVHASDDSSISRAIMMLGPAILVL